MTIQNQYVTAEDLSTLLSCSISLIRKLKRENKIPFIKVGNSVRFPLEEVISCLKGGDIHDNC